MKKKPTILLIIDDLGKGGAEMLLVGILQDLLRSYEVVLVTLTRNCDFDRKNFAGIIQYDLGIKNKWNYFAGIYKLKKLIKKYQPALVHAHLVYSTIVARMACPKKIPLLFSVHNEIGKNVFKKSPVLSFLEKATLSNNQTLIAVSNAVLSDYEAVINFKGEKNVLQNYISDEFYNNSHRQKNVFKPGSELKMIALGNVKHSKNYEYLIQSFKHLKGLPVSVDIYGKKDEVIFPALQSVITADNLAVNFKGVAKDIPALFSDYHLYVMPSSHEGFGIAAVEAMACRLPLLLSDLDVLREVTFSNAIFFDLKDEMSLATAVKKILQGGYDLNGLSEAGIRIAEKYSKQEYLEKLYTIYRQALLS